MVCLPNFAVRTVHPRHLKFSIFHAPRYSCQPAFRLSLHAGILILALRAWIAQSKSCSCAIADQWIGGWAGSYLADLLRDNTTLTSLELFGMYLASCLDFFLREQERTGWRQPFLSYYKYLGTTRPSRA
eukprot:695882-Pleurochrysis_carterae.AAC.4